MDHLVDMANQTDFPWLMSNVKDRSTGRLLAEGVESIIMDWEGRKVGPPSLSLSLTDSLTH